MKKSKEVFMNFIEGLSVEFTDDIVTVETKFQMSFPNDWKRSDILDWVEGFNRLTIGYLELSMKKMVSLHKSGEEFDDFKNKKTISVLRQIEKNQNWSIQKIK